METQDPVLELIAELKVKDCNDLKLSVDKSSNIAYYVLADGDFVVTYPNTNMGQCDAMLRFERCVWDRINKHVISR